MLTISSVRIKTIVLFHRGFPGGSAVKNLPAMQEPQEKQVQSLGQKDPLEEDTVIHTSISYVSCVGRQGLYH